MLQYPLTDPCPFDILQSGPGWRGSDAIRSTTSATIKCCRDAPPLYWWLGACLAPPCLLFARGASFQAMDSNNDGMLGLEEIKEAASKKFDELDRNHSGTLSRKQLGRLRLSRKDFAAADTDKDGTLTKDEYLVLVERRFMAAEADHSGMLTLEEFNSRAGLPLRRLIY
jgi:EF hand